jgi:hypothetical protein
MNTCPNIPNLPPFYKDSDDHSDDQRSGAHIANVPKTSATYPLDFESDTGAFGLRGERSGFVLEVLPGERNEQKQRCGCIVPKGH